MIFLICFVKYSINDVVLSSSSFLWKMTRTATAGTSQAYRPSSQSGRPMSGVALLYITTTTTIIIITTIITIQYSGEQARQRGRQARYHGGRFENAKNCQNCKTGLGHIWKVISGIIKFQTFMLTIIHQSRTWLYILGSFYWNRAKYFSDWKVCSTGHRFYAFTSGRTFHQPCKASCCFRIFN